MKRPVFSTFRTASSVILLFLCVLLAIARTRSPQATAAPQSTKANDQLAWQTLAQSTGPSSGAAPETPVAWRLWATSQEIFGAAPLPPASVVFTSMRPLACRQSVQNPNVANPAAQCEIVFVNSVAANYIAKNGLTERRQVITVATHGLRFPDQSIEIKTEWIPLIASQTNYVVGLNGSSRYGLVAFHLKAKVLPNSQWLWATFIQKDKLPKGFQIQDAYGLKPDRSISTDLQTLLTNQGASVLANYLLLGTQTNLAFGPNSLLGNPLIEGLTDPTLQHSSCVGCHNLASISKVGTWWQPSVLATANPSRPSGQLGTDNDWGAAGKPLCQRPGNACLDGQTSSPLL
jgi:hypothetical protein